MRFFSRRNASLALSLAAVGVLAACGDDVTVPVAPAAPVTVTITPQAISLTPGSTAQLSVQITGGDPTPTLASCASGSSAVATAAVSGNGCRVTAVAAGSTTITATTSAGQAASAAVNVSAAPAAIGTLSVSPAQASLGIGGTVQLTPVFDKGADAVTTTVSYTSSATSIATVSTSGLVTGVAQGSATITVNVTGTGAGFSTVTRTAAVAITVAPPAQVIINSLSQNGAAVDISNVAGQFEVNLSLQPNGQIVSSVQAWVCNAGETVAACATRSGKPAAQQTFGTAGAQAGAIQLYVNSAEFDAPNFTTGADANTLYKNGLKTLVATVTTAGGTAPSASNNLSSVNFNNTDGFTISWTLPTKKANDAAGNTWYGGPGAEGTGSFTVVPVMYTPSRTIKSVTLNPAATGACGGDIVDDARPFTATYGDQTFDEAKVAFDCSGIATNLDGHAPVIVASLDSNNAAGPTANGGVAGPAKSIFALLTAPAPAGGQYYQSLAYRGSSIFVPADWERPDITTLEVRGGGAASLDSGWVNGAYAFNRDGSYEINDGAGVGLFAEASRNTEFRVCNTPATIPGDARVSCDNPVKTGGLTATVSSMGLGENATNFTNQAYFLVATETDRLGNRATSNAFSYVDADGNTMAATDNRNTFGVDVTAPALVAIPNQAGTADDPLNPPLAGVRSGTDSIFTSSANGNTTSGASSTGITAMNSGTALFAVRVQDTRSGFFSCTAGVSCATTSGSEYHLGTFQIVRRRAPNSVGPTNAATVENIIATPTATNPAVFSNVMNGTAVAGVTGLRQFSINIFGAAGRAPTGVTVGSTQPGYYSISGTLTDRAGNTSSISPAGSSAVSMRNAAIDIAAPTITNVIANNTYTGGAITSVTVQGSDDLEIAGAELRVGFTSAPTGGISLLEFPRVTNFAATIRSGLFQGPFAALSSNLLGYVSGPGQAFAGTLSMPIGFIQDMQYTSGDAGTVVAPGAAAANKPNSLAARLFDIKAMTSVTATLATTRLANSVSAWSTPSTITPAQVTGGDLRKNWGATETVGSVVNPGAGLVAWTVYNASATSNGGVVEFRAQSNTSSSNPPFSAVYIVLRRFNTTTNQYENHEYRGAAAYAGILDDGGARYFRYTAPAASIGAIAQGNNVTLAAFTGLDQIRAIGVDAQGNALATPAALRSATAAPVPFTVAAGSNFIINTPAVATTGPWSSTRQNVFASADQSNIAIGSSPIIPSTGRVTRMYFQVVNAAGFSGATNVACSSSNLAVATVTLGGPVNFNGSTTNDFYFCDVTGAAAGSAAISATYYNETPGGVFAPVGTAATPATTALGTVTVSGTADATLLSLAASVQSAWTTTAGVTTSTFTVTPTWVVGYTQANAPMTYRCYVEAANVVAPTCAVSAVNSATGVLTVTLTNSATAISGNIRVIGRAVHATAYANPVGISVAVTPPLPASITSVSVTPGSAPIFVGETQTFTSVLSQPTGAPAGTTYSWAFVGACTAGTLGATTNSSLVFTATAAGTCTVRVTATNAGNGSYAASTVTGDATVTVSAVPAAIASISNITEVPGFYTASRAAGTFTFTPTVNKTSGYTGTVTVTASLTSGAPQCQAPTISGGSVTVTINPNSANRTCTLDVTFTPAAQIGFLATPVTKSVEVRFE